MEISVKVGDSLNATIHLRSSEKYVTIIKDLDPYEGPYEVIPSTQSDQLLETKDKRMEDNLNVKEIPTYEVSNDSKGTTLYIGKEVI